MQSLLLGPLFVRHAFRFHRGLQNRDRLLRIRFGFIELLAFLAVIIGTQQQHPQIVRILCQKSIRHFQHLWGVLGLLVGRGCHAERLIRVRRIRENLREPRQEPRTLGRILGLIGSAENRLLNVRDAILVVF